MNCISIALILYLSVQQCLCQIDCFGEGLPKKGDPAAVAKGADDFGLILFTDIAKSYPHNSIVLSLYSVWSVLNLAYFGSGGNTEIELQRALRVASKGDSFYGSRIVDARLKLNEGTTFNKVDKAYFANDIALRQCSINKLTEIEKLNFADSAGAARKINQDISLATEGKIKNFLSAGIIANSRFVLINAVYFKGLWKFPFPVDGTKEKPFYDESRTITVGQAKMMTTSAKLRYYNSESVGAAFVELPYEQSDISMILILPTHGQETVNSVLMKLTADVMEDVTRNFTTRPTMVSLPRFKMTTRIADELKTGLQNLGVNDLFDATKINLTNFIPVERVKVDDSLHQATIEVSEEGTVAAAATGLIGTRSGASQMAVFIAERPFIFMIRDVAQGLTIFTGVLRNPNHTVDF